MIQQFRELLSIENKAIEEIDYKKLMDLIPLKEALSALYQDKLAFFLSQKGNAGFSEENRENVRALIDAFKDDLEETNLLLDASSRANNTVISILQDSSKERQGYNPVGEQKASKSDYFAINQLL